MYENPGGSRSPALVHGREGHGSFVPFGYVYTGTLFIFYKNNFIRKKRLILSQNLRTN